MKDIVEGYHSISKEMEEIVDELDTSYLVDVMDDLAIGLENMSHTYIQSNGYFDNEEIEKIIEIFTAWKTEMYRVYGEYMNS